MKFKAIDLFCGAGGLSTGLKKSGFRLCLGVDIDEKALKTYKCNLKRTKVLKYSGSVVKTQIQSFYNELIYVVEEGEGCSPYAA